MDPTKICFAACDVCELGVKSTIDLCNQRGLRPIWIGSYLK